MTSEPHAAVHADQRRWLADLAMWQDDLGLWQRELSAALSDLDRAVGALSEHAAAVEGHGERLRAAARSISDREWLVSKYDRGEPAPGVVQVVEGHGRSAEEHDRLRDAHERLKKCHHVNVAKVASLLKSLAGSR